MFKGLSCVFSSRIFNRSSLGRTLTQSWRLQGRVRFIEVEENVFLVLFNGEKKLKSVLEGGWWLFDDHIFLLQRWCTGLRTRRGEDGGTHRQPLSGGLEDRFGEEQNGFVRQRYIRVRVVVDTSEPLARGVMINSGEAKHWIRFKYERLPMFVQDAVCWDMKRGVVRPKTLDGIQYSNDLRDVIVSKKGHLRLPVSSSNFSYGSWGSGGLKFARGSDGGGRVPVEERRAGREALNGDRFGKVVSHMNVNENDLGEDSGDVDINGAFLNESGKESNGLKKITIGKSINAAQSGHSSHGLNTNLNDS
ncbi:PREDICTED: LOC110689843 [Prunus dulcis]|uniref:PREDICTED: LOC110689843 n=1 Tax=Prunus dulcis TaxID=3755 RepID=A0A5E4FAU9_PRUDU|nr:PREDICTED: LOC110689843 [Prunus dulcis]